MDNVNHFVKINTSKIKNVHVKPEFLDNFKIYKVKITEDEYYGFYKYLRENIKHLSDFKSNEFVYILSNKKIHSKQYLFEDTNINMINNFITLNLILKGLPYIIKSKSYFSCAENLSYFYDVKEISVKSANLKYKEYLALEVSVSPQMVLNINGATYTEKSILSQLFILNNNYKKLGALKRRTVYCDNGDQIMHYSRMEKNKETDEFSIKNYNEKMKEIVKMKYNPSQRNSTQAVSLNPNDFEKTKNGCIFYLFHNLKSVSNLITFELEEVQGRFVPSSKSKDSIGRTKKELSYKDALIDFYKDRNLMIIDTTNNKANLNRVKEEIYNYGVPHRNIYTSSTSMDKADNFIVITNTPKEYNKGEGSLIKDPYTKRHNLRHQHINIEQDKVKSSDFYKNAIPVILKELIIKDNLRKGRIEHLQAQDNLFMKISPPKKNRESDDINKTFIGIHISNCNITHIDDEYVSNNTHLFEHLLNNEKLLELYEGEDDFYILSYGDKTSDVFFSNIAIISDKDERPLPPIHQIGNEYYKKKSLGSKAGSLLSRSIKNQGVDFAFAGVFGMFYIEINNTNIDYYVGPISSDVKSTVPRFPKLHNVSYIQGSFNQKMFFTFFEHYYITNNESTTLPYLNKYIREWENYL